MRLHPWPDDRELATYYPPSYWYAPGSERLSEWEERYRRLVLLDHVRFVMQAVRASGVPGRVLDVGCGGGLFLRLLLERGVPVVGLDLSPEAARIAWRHHDVPALCGTLPAAPLAPASCAIITMFHVLEHLKEPERYLRAAHALLHPEGRLVIQVPNVDCWQFLLLGESWNGLDVPRHLIDFRPRDVDTLLHYCGFDVVRHKHFSLRDNPAGLATSLAPSLDPMARRIRRVPETPLRRAAKSLAYLALTAAAVPFTLLEAACQAGSTLMVEAKPRP